MPSADELRRAIQPGSIPYGERQELEQGLSQLPQLGQEQGQGDAGPSAQRPAIPPTPTDPLGALLSGEISVADDEPTAGLSVGAGPGGQQQQEQPFTDDFSERLRYLAQFAQTPMLRAQARRALQRRVKAGSL